MTDVERQEEQLLASGRRQGAARCVDDGRGGRRAGPVDAGAVAADMTQATEGRWGSGGVEITDVSLLDDRRPATHIFHTGEPVTLRLSLVRARARCSDFVFGVGIFNAEGVVVYGTNTDIEEFDADELVGRGRGPPGDRRRSTWSRAPTSSTSPCTGATVRRTTTIGCSTPSA